MNHRFGLGHNRANSRKLAKYQQISAVSLEDSDSREMLSRSRTPLPVLRPAQAHQTKRLPLAIRLQFFLPLARGSQSMRTAGEA
jgi:hypothetical protein